MISFFNAAATITAVPAEHEKRRGEYEKGRGVYEKRRGEERSVKECMRKEEEQGGSKNSEGEGQDYG